MERPRDRRARELEETGKFAERARRNVRLDKVAITNLPPPGLQKPEAEKGFVQCPVCLSEQTCPRIGAATKCSVCGAELKAPGV